MNKFTADNVKEKLKKNISKVCSEMEMKRETFHSPVKPSEKKKHANFQAYLNIAQNKLARNSPLLLPVHCERCCERNNE